MKLWDLMDMDLYRQMVSEKFVRTNDFTLDEHDFFKKRTYTILNYTEKAQFDNVWNEVTKQCRGLIIDKNFNVIARPFDKFMNYTDADNAFLDESVLVTDKMDGSLGIIFCSNKQTYGDNWQSSRFKGYENAIYREPWKAEWSLITRGSYDSEQAQFGREWLKQHLSQYDLNPAWTYLVEIIYPENRIVVNYGDRKELVWLGARNIETGLVRHSPSQWEWLGTRTRTFDYKTLREALECPPRTNAEGYVVYFPKLDYRIKVKQDDYVALHRIVTGLTERRVWENMKEGKTLSDLCEIVPDEWHEWLSKTYVGLAEKYAGYKKVLTLQYRGTKIALGSGFDRKEFALAVKDTPYAGLMFALLDGNNIDDKIWDLVKPKAE